MLENFRARLKHCRRFGKVSGHSEKCPMNLEILMDTLESSEQSGKFPVMKRPQNQSLLSGRKNYVFCLSVLVLEPTHQSLFKVSNARYDQITTTKKAEP